MPDVNEAGFGLLVHSHVSSPTVYDGRLIAKCAAFVQIHALIADVGEQAGDGESDEEVDDLPEIELGSEDDSDDSEEEASGDDEDGLEDEEEQSTNGAKVGKSQHADNASGELPGDSSEDMYDSQEEEEDLDDDEMFKQGFNEKLAHILRLSQENRKKTQEVRETL
eukprot:SAG25_NODE_382_length_8794_cov_3.620012_2_plen_166_part_00